MSINDIINGILVLIPAGCAVRLAILAVSLMLNQDEEKDIKNKMLHTLMFAVISSSVGLIKTLVLRYYAS